MSEGAPGNEEQEVSFDELRVFLRDEEIDIPAGRRDISDSQNLRWLSRNLLVRNQDKVPVPYWEALKRAYRRTLN